MKVIVKSKWRMSGVGGLCYIRPNNRIDCKTLTVTRMIPTASATSTPSYLPMPLLLYYRLAGFGGVLADTTLP